ncbi:unnamed protein product [Moneuplotes crassus]|uniref:TRP C-terminal domain-containing protein n=1 Tax=Euplotes crassus TaxID=5936 RepID=A0AAD1XRW3_EUPCR|nr:unnamed protein product [Moneuplotes crassus]
MGFIRPFCVWKTNCGINRKQVIIKTVTQEEREPLDLEPSNTNLSSASLQTTSNSVSPKRELAAVCGDGTTTNPETCDDGNTASGDGCSSSCTIEVGFTCSGATCTDICADGIVMSRKNKGEYIGCDDGNTANGDGCSSSCTTETGYICYEGNSTTKDTCYELCGDGTRLPNNTNPNYCDDGNSRNGDGCSKTCQVEEGYLCGGGNITHKDVCINECTVLGCAVCKKDNDKQCITCITGFGLLSDGTCGYGVSDAESGDKYDEMGHVSLAISKATMGTAVGVAILTSTAPSSAWILANQIQLFSLFLLTNTKIPTDVINYIKRLDTFMFSMKFLPLSGTSTYGKLTNPIEKEQKHQSLKNISLEYQSSICNNIGVLLAFCIVILIHITIFWIPRRSSIVNHTSSKARFNKIMNAIFKIFTFGVYIRLALQAFQYLLLGVVSELKEFDTSEIAMAASLIFAAIFGCIATSIFVISIIQACRKPENEEEVHYKLQEYSSGLRDKRLARVYTPVILFRRFFFVGLLVLFSSSESTLLVVGMILFQVLYILAFCVIRPHEAVINNILELTNEGIFTILLGFLLKVNTSDEWSRTMRSIFTWVMLVNIIIVFVFVITCLVHYVRKMFGKDESLASTRKISSIPDHSISINKMRPVMNDISSNPVYESQPTKQNKNSFVFDWMSNASPPRRKFDFSNNNRF